MSLSPAPDLTATAVLGAVDAARDAETQATAAKLAAVLDWVAIHSEESLVQPSFRWEEQPLPLGGQGAPKVAEFALTEIAAHLGMSREAARTYVGNAVELRYRLPRLHRRVAELEVPVWRALRISERTHQLPPQGATWVDAQVAPYAEKVGPAQLDRMVETALAQFDPAQLEEQREAAMEHRHARLHQEHVQGGCVEFSATMDIADGMDLDLALTQVAAELATLGSQESYNVRRSQALGQLGRNQLAFALAHAKGEEAAKSPRGPDATEEPQGASKGPKPRQVVLHIHLDSQALEAGLAFPTGNGRPALARLEKPHTLLSIEQLAAWCTHPDTHVTIKPVIDLNDTHTVRGYQVPQRFKDHIALRDRTCVFPHCNRTARHTDADHILSWDSGGPTTTRNLAPLCRAHHRAKTTGGWHYLMLTPGTYEWTSPHGTHWLVDPSGTTCLTRPPDH
jgi:hypothetical protein